MSMTVEILIEVVPKLISAEEERFHTPAVPEPPSRRRHRRGK